jgi:hypothetical protein
MLFDLSDESVWVQKKNNDKSSMYALARGASFYLFSKGMVLLGFDFWCFKDHVDVHHASHRSSKEKKTKKTHIYDDRGLLI